MADSGCSVSTCGSSSGAGTTVSSVSCGTGSNSVAYMNASASNGGRVAYMNANVGNPYVAYMNGRNDCIFGKDIFASKNIGTFA